MKRIIKVAKEFNVGTSSIIHFLNGNGYEYQNRPTTKISQEAYSLVEKEFSSSKELKFESELIDSEKLKNIYTRAKGKPVLNLRKEKNNYTSFSRRKKLNYYNSELITSSASGVINFIDYEVNEFGIIKDVAFLDKNENKATVVKVHIKVENLKTKSRLFTGKQVIFELFKSNQGYFAKNLITIAECDLKTVLTLIQAVDESRKNILLELVLKNEKLSENEKENIRLELLKKMSIHNWILVNKYFNKSTIKLYQEKHLQLVENIELESYLGHVFNKEFFLLFISRYKFVNFDSLFDLVKRIASNLSLDELPQSFLKSNENLEESLSLNNFLSCLRIVNAKIFFDWAISKFSFLQYQFPEQLKEILSSKFCNQNEVDKIVGLLWEEINELSSENVLKIYNEFNLIKDLDDFFILLSASELDKLTFRRLVESKEVKLSEKQIVILYQKFNNLSYEDLKRLLQDFSSYNYLVPHITNDLFSISLSKKQFENLLEFLSNDYVGKDIAIGFSRRYSLVYINVSNVKLITFLYDFDRDQIKFILSKLRFATRSEFIKLRDFLFSKIDIFELIQMYRNENKGLVDILRFFYSPSEALVTKEFNDYVFDNPGFLQVSLCMRVLSELHRNNIDKATVIRIFDKIEWSEISAILIKAFVNLPQYTKKIILDTLNIVFKSHFEILKSNNVKSEQFLKTFTIKDIINYCNCRKTYNGEFWQAGKIARWYFNGDTSSISSGNKETYYNSNEVVFCEGRFWKKGDFFNNETKSRIEGGDFFWCRGSYCAKVNDNCDLTQPYDNWTLSEVSKVLSLPIDRLVFTTLSGWANRMNEIVERLICRSCNDVLRPLPFTPKTLGYNAVPVFNCINQSCEKHKMSIRFTHCLNGKCNNTLDSRDCESCIPENTRHIGMKCNECGTLCPKCSGTWNRIEVEIE